jgi:hypothetical protein
MQNGTDWSEDRRFSPPTDSLTWGGSEIYGWLNNIGFQFDPLTNRFASGELHSVQRTNVNTTGFDFDLQEWVPMSGSTNTMFYLLNVIDEEGAGFRPARISWSASLENSESKLIDPSRIPNISPNPFDPTAYWLRSLNTRAGFDHQVYAVNNSNAIGSTIVSRNMGLTNTVLPVFRLDADSVVFISEIGLSGLGSTAPVAFVYSTGPPDTKRYKLTVLGDNNGAGVGNLSGVPAGDVTAVLKDGLTLTGLAAEPLGAGTYTLVYKIVRDNYGIIGYGTSSDLTTLSIDTSGLAKGEKYTVHVWLQRNNPRHSHEATVPRHFTLYVSDPCGECGEDPCECLVPVHYGDVNGDGFINAADVTILRRFIAAGNPEPFTEAPSFIRANADANGDGRIDSEDVTLLRRYLSAANPTTVPLGPQPEP